MNFKKYSGFDGKHAFLGGSNYHWINYDDDKLIRTYLNSLAVQRGTRLHKFASDCISLEEKLPRTKRTLNMFVNDAISKRMESEQPLVYSDNCFGTADAISFDKGLLSIHDLKTGSTPAHMEQLLIYCAYFCLEYDISPYDIEMVLRIYQNDEIVSQSPDPNDIRKIEDKVIRFDSIIEEIKEKEDVRP